ncbi:hypothetical protein MN116_004676 [Schistosoma mekongi]|uniref:Uncharacterized protein n=1 Tax=Schistosoma mekongi TaxID=38744 RepID=A0AAE1ZD51_SCHME|nr:hypothetical protein MN116_004676 [Schistosoma mekongi]
MVKTNREHNLRLLQQKLDKETNALEQKMLDVKPWYLQGEIVATKRNENTLLEEHFDVQRHGLFKPNVQDEAVIDDYIIKAVKERMFDSPVFKVKEVKTLRKELPLQNVVQKSLVEDYEGFLRKNQILEEDQGDVRKNAIQSEMLELFDDLDKLSNLHFVPHKYIPESISVKNDAACKLEEIGPMVVSTSNLLAPEEICPPRGEILIGKKERTLADRRRHRRKLMRIRSQHAKKGKVNERQIAMAKITKMAHRPNSNIKIVK